MTSPLTPPRPSPSADDTSRNSLDDIAERMRAEETLQQERVFTDAVLDSVPGLLYLYDAEGHLVRWNRQHEIVTGYTAEELGRMTLLDWYKDSPEDVARITAGVQKALAEGYAEAEGNLQTKDGRRLLFRFNAVRLEIQGKLYFAGIGIDITESRRRDEALRSTERMLAEIFRSSPAFIVVSTADEGRFIEANEAFTKALGFEHGEVIGRLSSDIGLWPSWEDRDRIVRAVDDRGAARDVETRVRRKDGIIIDVSMSVAPITVGGQPCLIWLGTDISARRRAEQEQIRLQEQLQQAVKMEAVGRLAGGIAHDFNNLLTVICGNVEMAVEDLDAADPLRQSLDDIKRAADSSVSLTRQLLAFSRRQIIEPHVVSLSELVRNLEKMLGRLIGEDIALQATLADDLGSVRVDPGQFEQVLVNLAVNARDAMPDGGRLVIETANTELGDTYCATRPDLKPGPFVMLAVSDTGHGMTSDVKRRLFEPFFTTKPKGRGTGLGLAMIFGAVRQSGGTIEVYSEPDHGTTFKIYLPRVDAPAERIAKPAKAAALPRGTETVFLVEDEASVRDIAITMLKRLGYRVHVASNGGEAFMMAESHAEPIHLLMTDVVMPGMNGRELAERLKVLHPEMSVLFTSGYTENVIVHHGVLYENLNFIGKPYSLQALATKLRHVLAIAGSAAGNDRTIGFRLPLGGRASAFDHLFGRHQVVAGNFGLRGPRLRTVAAVLAAMPTLRVDEEIQIDAVAEPSASDRDRPPPTGPAVPRPGSEEWPNLRPAKAGAPEAPARPARANGPRNRQRTYDLFRVFRSWGSQVLQNRTPHATVEEYDGNGLDTTHACFLVF